MNKQKIWQKSFKLYFIILLSRAQFTTEKHKMFTTQSKIDRIISHDKF